MHPEKSGSCWFGLPGTEEAGALNQHQPTAAAPAVIRRGPDLTENPALGGFHRSCQMTTAEKNLCLLVEDKEGISETFLRNHINNYVRPHQF